MIDPILLEITTTTPTDVLHAPGMPTVVKSLILLFLGFPLIYLLGKGVEKTVKKRGSAHVAVMMRKVVIYIGTVLLVATLLVELGFNLSAILGAAGIASVAIGFAAQTSLSNMISGVFLYWERPFEIGDVIKVGDTLGIVLSIDLMSVKLRSFDNHYIRIPNESLIKSQSTTITRFPIRRLTVPVSVSYKSDIQQVVNALKAVAEKNPHCLDEPEPLIVFDKFGESSLDFIFGPWTEKTEFLLLKNSIMKDIKEHFDACGIEIPFPQRVLHFEGKNDLISEFKDSEQP